MHRQCNLDQMHILKMTNPLTGSLTNKVLSGVAFKEQKHKKKIIAHLSDKKESTIPEIADLLNISVPKSNELITILLSEGLVIESGHKSEGIGRRATTYGLNKDRCYFLGVEIKKYTINIALMGFDKSIEKKSLNIPFPFLDPLESLDAIIDHISEFLKQPGIQKDKIAGVGLSVAGRINAKTGEILTFYHFGDAPVKTKLEEALGLPVYLDNDSRTIAYGEYFFGGIASPENMLVVNLDYGLAIGIFINGKPVYGTSGYAGELGHAPLSNNEKICYCGKKGCLETEASGFALIDYITSKMKEGSSSRLSQTLDQKGYLELEDIVQAVKKGDNLAIEGMSEIGYKLGKGLAVALNLLNPSAIIIGGALSAIGEPMLMSIQTSIFQHSLSIVNADTVVAVSKINVQAGLLGCCVLVRDKILGLL